MSETRQPKLTHFLGALMEASLRLDVLYNRRCHTTNQGDSVLAPQARPDFECEDSLQVMNEPHEMFMRLV